MEKGRAPVVVANWKMNGSLLEGMQFFKELRRKIHESLVGCEIVICPPFTLLRDFAEKIPGTGIKLGGQNCNHYAKGAYTGEISARQLKDMTCDYVILGHSERRMHNNEGSELVQKKAATAHKEKINTIICIGETQYERDNDLTKIVLREQILHSIPNTATVQNTIIAYEPVWAIGTGVIPTSDEIRDTHQFILDVINDNISILKDNVKLIYGGSVNKENSNNILNTPGVDGLLVGKASLDIEEFWNIVSSVS